MGSASTTGAADRAHTHRPAGRAAEAAAHVSAVAPHRAQEIAGRLWAGTGDDPRMAFDPSMIAGCPEPAQRWLAHAIAPGTRLAAGALLRMR